MVYHSSNCIVIEKRGIFSYGFELTRIRQRSPICCDIQYRLSVCVNIQVDSIFIFVVASLSLSLTYGKYGIFLGK